MPALVLLTASYVVILNNIVYANSRLPPTENRRQVSVIVSDGTSSSSPVFSTITFIGQLRDPVLDLNGNEPGTDTMGIHITTTPPLELFPEAFLNDPDGDNICSANITVSGPDATCAASTITFGTAFSDIVIDPMVVVGEVTYQLSSMFTDCREALVYQSILRGITFSSPEGTTPGVCNISVAVEDARRSESNTALGVVEIRTFNAPPFIDLDLGLSGRDFSTRYFQGGRTQHIVSIFDPATARNISDTTVVGEADGEAPFDDGTIYHGVVILEESNAGYSLIDVDSPTLAYLEVELILAHTLENDVIRYPCLPNIVVPENGCHDNPLPITFDATTCDASVFDACASTDDLCSDLQVTIFCSSRSRKAYRFAYTSNPATSRYEILLGFLGYDFLLPRGGLIEQIRLLNISVYDGISEMSNPQAITRVRIRNQDVVIIIVDPAPPNTTFIVYEDERPGRTCNLYELTVMRLDGTFPSADELVFNFTLGNTGEAFGIGEDGKIFLNNPVDREMIQFYHLTVTARLRNADPDTTASAQLIAEVIDVNDNHPVTADSYSVNVTEGMVGGQVVQVVATDADIGENANLTYLILGIGAENFQVDNNGLVTTRKALNLTIVDYYLLVMIITDRGEISLSTHTVINVYVITPPPTNLEFNPFDDPLGVFENVATGSVAGAVSAFEVGGTGETTFIRYRFVELISDATGLSESPAPFDIDSETGSITVNAGLDSERSTGYSVVIEAFSVRTLFPPGSAYANFTIAIQDVNEEIPMFTDAPYAVDVLENAVTGTPVLTLVATDNDAMNMGLIYSLHSSVPAGLPFSVSPSGQITVSGVINFETIQSYQFIVQVRDDPAHSMPSMSATAQVTVTVIDENDNAPVFVGAPYNVSVRETEQDGYVLLTFSTTDEDSLINRNVSYSVEGIEDTPFCLEGLTIQVCNASELTDIEVSTEFNLVLVATNPPGPMVSMATLNIELILVNEFDPELDVRMVNHSGLIEENCGVADCVGVVVYDISSISSDLDGGFGGQLSYSLLTPGVPFFVDSFSGLLIVSAGIDREERDFYSLEIRVQDGGDIDGITRMALFEIDIPIIDIDDNIPVIVPPTEFFIPEDMTQSGQVFGQVNFTDRDIVGIHSFTFTVSADPPISVGCLLDPSDPIFLPIQIDPNSGELSFCTPIDFETGPNTFRVNIVVNDVTFVNGVGFDSEVYTFQVTDANDNPPSFVATNYTFNHEENLVGDPVGTVTAMDVDSGENGRLQFSIVGQSSSDCSNSMDVFGVRNISATEGSLVTCDSLDYENVSLYQLTVRVCDSAAVPMCDDVSVTVNVLDRNDNPPLFSQPSYFMDIRETDTSMMNTSVIVLETTDADTPANSITSYVILTLSTPFGLRAATNNSVEIVVADPDAIDFDEGTRMYEIEVSAINRPADVASDVSQITNVFVSITILDVNDNAPVIMTPFEFAVRENLPEDSTVGCVVATDADSGARGELEFSFGDNLADCSPEIPFAVNQTTGCLSTCVPLDYEQQTSYTFVVVVCDRSIADVMMCSSRNFTVNVLDLNDNVPEYSQDPFIVDVNENSVAGASVVLITSTDLDSVNNSFVFYSFQNTSGPFGLRAVNEVFYTGIEELDYEGPTQTYVSHLRGTNPPFFTDDQTQIVDVALVINIVDRNDQPPVFPQADDTVSVLENSPDGMIVYSLSTTDADTTLNSLVRYEILEPNTPFMINGESVVISNSAALDFDPPGSLQQVVLTIQAINEATGDETQTSNFTLTVLLIDVNDNSPQCAGQDRFLVPEDLMVMETTMMRVMAVDIDAGNNGQEGIEFTLRGMDMTDPPCSLDFPFSVDPDSGHITVACMSLDYEQIMLYDVNVTVCDGGSPPRCTVCPITVIVTDVNDNPPAVNPPFEFSVAESSPIGSLVGCINADDADSGQNALLNYALAADFDDCSTDTPFFLNDTTGCIEVCLLLDFETDSSFSFTVEVVDNGSPSLSSEENITINVINVNDHPPVITSSSTANVVEERANEFVLTVIAADSDAPPFDIFTFSLHDDAGGSFNIDSLSGIVQTTRALDRETQEMYTIVVEVTDGVFTTNQTVTVILVDINDNPPEYLGSVINQFLEETLFDLQLLYRDNDTGVNANLTYAVDDARFFIDTSGVLRNNVELDRDPDTGGNPIITIVITARDPTLVTNTIITIELTDINDNAPIPVTPFMADVIDGTRAGQSVITVVGSDADAGLNAVLVFTLTDPTGTFVINEATGVVTLLVDLFLTSSMVETHTFVVNISDSGLPRQVTQQEYTIFVINSVPEFPEPVYNFNVSENEFGVVVGALQAMDRDNNEFNDAFEYSIISVTPYNAGFSVTSSGGIATIISPSGYLDFEDASAFTIILGVSRPNMSDLVIDNNTTLVVTVIDVNDNIPRLSPLNITAELAENSADGTIVARAVAIDFDTGARGQLTFNHSGTGEEHFEFDASGNFLVANGGSIDFEADTSFTFIYQACDSGSPQVCSQVGFIFITVVNIDDLPPVFNPTEYTLFVSEAIGASMLLTYINFTDPDTPLEDVELTLDPPQTQFAIILLSGVGALMTTNVPLDRETLAVHTFSVVATDTSSANASATVTVVLLDENDFRPRVEPLESVAYFQEGIGTAAPAINHSIIDVDDLSLFPVTSVEVSLHPSPTSSESYPLSGGMCDHANYSRLYDNNVHSLCGLRGCTYLFNDLAIPLGGQFVDGILELPGFSDIARNPSVFFEGSQLVNFSLTIWVRFSQPTSGNILEVQSNVNVFGLRVRNDGGLEIFFNPTPTSTQVLLDTSSLNTHDGEWHQIAVVRQNNSMALFFDCEEVASTNDLDQGGLIDTPFIRADFNLGSFFLGNRLAGGFYSEFYFCDSVVQAEHVCCTLTCGETFEVAPSTPTVTTSVDIRRRTVLLTYIGSDNLASLPDLEAAMRTVVYRNILDEPHPLDRGVFFLVTDMIGPSDTQTVITLRPVLINDQPPVLDLNGDGQPGVNFNTAFDETSQGTQIIGLDAILFVRDSGYWPLVRITVELISAGPLEMLVNSSTTLMNGVTVTLSNGQAVLTPTDSSVPVFPEAYLESLRGIQYIDREEEPIQFDRQIQFQVDDSLHVNDPLSVTTVTVTPTNDKPALDLNNDNSATTNTTVLFNERDGRVTLVDSARVSILDPDSTEASSAVFTFISRPDNEQEALVGVDLLDGVTQTFDSAAGILTLEGVFPFTTWTTILGQVQYLNANGNPNQDDNREVSVVITDADGATSDPSFISITLALFNNPPTIFLGGPGEVPFSTIFIEDGDCIPVASPDALIVDADTNTFRVLSITLSNVNTNNEVLSVIEPHPQQTFFSGSRRVIFFLVDNTLSEYEAALSQVRYCNPDDEPDETGERTIDFQLTDNELVTPRDETLAGQFSQVSTTTITIQRVNDRPELFFEPLNNISIRGVPTPIINPDTIAVLDSDDDFFSELSIYITNPQNGDDNEIIEFARQLPESTVSIGPLQAPNGQILYNVTFQGEGADRARVIETIEAIRYNNRASDIIVDPPREICLQVSDFKIFSFRQCANVTISPANNFNPVFDSNTETQFAFFETDNSISVTMLAATDDDPGLEGQISYVITRVESFNTAGPFTTITFTEGIFVIDSIAGDVTAPSGLDADIYQLHNVTVVAADMGNPTLTASIVLTVNVNDLNDISPEFQGTPYVATPQREQLDPPRAVFQVTAVDGDVTFPNNAITSYSLENFQDRFSIDPASGLIMFTETLDAEAQSEYILSVTAVDGGSPPLTSFITVSFSLIDFNDNAAEIQQLAPALYVVGGNATSIGPALRITDLDLGPPAISELQIILTPNPVDSGRSYGDCLTQCQDERLAEAGLLSTAYDLLNLATFASDEPNPTAFTETVIGAGNCAAVSVTRGINRATDGYGRISRTNLPSNLVSGDFSISVVLTQSAEGYLVVIPDLLDPTLDPAAVERDFGIWIRRNDIRFYYLYGPSRTRGVDDFNIANNFDPAAPFTRHYTFIVRSSPMPTYEIYIDCTRVVSRTLLGAPLTPDNSLIDLFIGNSRPAATNGGRLAGTIHGLYYHPTALTQTELLDFCSCGFESIQLPSLPASINPIIVEETRIILQASSTLIPEEDAISVLRGITYINTFNPPTFQPPRQLMFSITEETGETGSTVGSVHLLSSDDALPELDISILSAGINYQTTFTEDAGPVVVAPNVRLTRNIEGFLTPAFDRVIVELTNGMDMNESLSAVSGVPHIIVQTSNDGRRIDVIGPGISADFVPVLDTLVYDNSDDRPDNSTSRVVRLTVIDTNGRQNDPQAMTTIQLLPVNDEPVIALSSFNGHLFSAVGYNESSPGVIVAPNVTVQDVDNDNLQAATVTLTSPNPDADTLAVLSPHASITATYSNSVLSLVGEAPLETYQEVLASVTFSSTDSPFLDNSGAPESDPTRIVLVAVSDGQLSSQPAQVTIQFIPQDDPPVVTIGNDIIMFMDGDDAIFIAPNADITDSDNRILASMNVELDTDRDDQFLRSDTLVGQVLVFNSAPIATFVSILRSIEYVNLAAEPTLVNRTITITVSDFVGSSVSQVTVIIVDENDSPPTFSEPEYNFSVNEDLSIGTNIGTLLVTDDDQVVVILSFTLSDPSVPFSLIFDSPAVSVVTTEPLNFEQEPMYDFMVVASDGINNGTTRLIVNVENVNEPPTIVLNPPNSSILLRPSSENTLIPGSVQISDPDVGDRVSTAFLMLRNVPGGSNETLDWTPLSGYTFEIVDENTFQLTTSQSGGDPLNIALLSVNYVVGSIVTSLTTIRTVAIVVVDEGGLFSEESLIAVSLASIPQFTQSVYNAALHEEMLVSNFLQVNASVESGGDVLEYSIDSGFGVVINSMTGMLSLSQVLDREQTPLVTFSVYAVDSLPPSRTGTATITITVLDQNDVEPAIGGLTNLTVFTNVDISPFSLVTVTDPDTVALIMRATVSLEGNEPLQPNPFTESICVDEYNAIDKMSLVCGLSSFLDLLENVLDTNDITDMQPGNNAVLDTSDGFKLINADFSSFNGQIREFTFALWVQASSSGYIAFYGNQDYTERYLALFYSTEDNQLILTLKREGLSGLSAQVRVNFQLSTSLSDGQYHFVMIQYVERDVLCVVDGVRMESVAVVYKEQPFIGAVFGKSAVSNSITSPYFEHNIYKPFIPFILISPKVLSYSLTIKN